jgi:hypothetical protein
MSEENKISDLSEQIVYFFDNVEYKRKIDQYQYRGNIDMLFKREKMRAEEVIHNKFRHFVYTVELSEKRNRLQIKTIYPLSYTTKLQFVDIIDNYILILRKQTLEHRVEYALDNVLVHGQKFVFNYNG